MTAQPHSPTAKRRKRLFNAVRILVCLGALGIVIQGVTIDDRVTLLDGEVIVVSSAVDRGESVDVIHLNGSRETYALDRIARDDDGALLISWGLRSAWGQSRLGFLLLAVLIHMPVGVLQGLRLRWMLSAQSIHLSYWQCVKLSFAGNFLNFATPLGSHAGDVFKAYWVSLHTKRKTEAVTTIVLDRIIGLGSLLLVVAIILIAYPGGDRLTALRPYVLGMVALGLLAMLVYLYPKLRRLIVPDSWLARLPLHDQLVRIDTATRTLARRRGIVLASVLITVALQATALTSYFCVAAAMQMQTSLSTLLAFYACFYIGALVQALPGPPQGLGTVELVYRYFLSAFGTPSQIVSVAFVIRLVVLLCALPGLLVTMTGTYKPESPSTEAKPDSPRHAAGSNPDEVEAVPGEHVR